MAAQTDSENQNLDYMRELKIGERITIECVENAGCDGCFLFDENDCEFNCGRRSYKEVQVHTFTDEELKTFQETYHTAGYELGVEKTLDVFCKLHCPCNHRCDLPNQPDCEVRNEFYKELRKEESK